MRCDVCGSSDNVFFIRPQVMGTDLHLCKTCAVARGHADIGANDGLDETALVCPKCGMTAERMRSGGQLGCTGCAKTFRREILSILRKSGRIGTYEGKLPPYSQDTFATEESARALSGKLEAAIHAEDFESAAEIRDKLKSIPGSGKP